jgi:hypothetical protein
MSNEFLEGIKDTADTYLNPFQSIERGDEVPKALKLLLGYTALLSTVQGLKHAYSRKQRSGEDEKRTKNYINARHPELNLTKIASEGDITPSIIEKGVGSLKDIGSTLINYFGSTKHPDWKPLADSAAIVAAIAIANKGVGGMLHKAEKDKQKKDINDKKAEFMDIYRKEFTKAASDG